MKRRRRFNLKDKRGMTLIEMVAVLAIITILATAVAMLFGPAIRSYQESAGQSRSSMILSNVLNRVEDELKYADEIEPLTYWNDSDQVDGIKSLNYKSLKYGKLRLGQSRAEEIYIKTIETDEGEETLGAGSLMFKKDFYMGHRAELGIVPGEADAVTKKSGTVCLKAVLYDEKGRVIGKREKWVTLLNAEIPIP